MPKSVRIFSLFLVNDARLFSRVWNPDETLALLFESSHCAQLLTYGAVGNSIFFKEVTIM